MTTCQNCKKNGIQEDYKFCPYCGVKIEKTLTCPRCGNTKIQGMKFCPECGTKIDPEILEVASGPTVLTEEAVPSQGYVIEFGYSSSANYDLAIAEAKKISTYTSFGNQKTIRHRVKFDIEDLDQLSDLVNYVQGWKTSRIYENGETSSFQTIFGFKWCYQERQNSYKPDLFCFGYEREWDLNLWGCIRAQMPFSENANWFTFGKWLNKDGDWQFDKKRILHELQTALYRYRFCPAIQLDLIQEVLNAIPDTVNPKKDKDWEYIEDWGRSDLSSGLIVTTVQYGIKEKVVMKGVHPTRNGIIALIKKIGSGKLPAGILK